MAADVSADCPNRETLRRYYSEHVAESETDSFTEDAERQVA